MALQGTLDTFALPDVLRLLAATNKTGQLRVAAQRGTGRISVVDGEVSLVEADHAPLAVDPVEATFELLRLTEGSFTFDPEADPGDSDRQEIEPLLQQAEAMLSEWRDIEAVVPSLYCWVTLRPELPADEVRLDANAWRTVVAVGAGATVATIGERLQLGELPVSRAVRDAVDLGVVDLQAVATPAVVEPRLADPVFEEPVELEPTSEDPATDLLADEGLLDETVAEDDARDEQPITRWADEPVDREEDDIVPDPSPVAELAPSLEDRPLEFPPPPPPPPGASTAPRRFAPPPPPPPSPESWRAADDEHTARDARDGDRIDGAPTGGDAEAPINRGLLLKFLSSSVKS